MLYKIAQEAKSTITKNTFHAMINDMKQAGKLTDAELRLEAMQAVVDAAVTWNDEVPSLSQVEAKLVSAVVAYRNLVEKEITV